MRQAAIDRTASADVTLSPATTEARRLVAALLAGQGRTDLARLVEKGDGDDFPEMITAGDLLQNLAARAARYEHALRQYADPDFWDDDMPGGALAFHDRGEIAANVLSGLPSFFHRD